MLHGFTKGVSVDFSYLQINDILEYNPPYVQSDFTFNSGLTLQLFLTGSNKEAISLGG